jgi:hypothetical protein
MRSENDAVRMLSLSGLPVSEASWAFAAAWASALLLAM